MAGGEKAGSCAAIALSPLAIDVTIVEQSPLASFNNPVIAGPPGVSPAAANWARMRGTPGLKLAGMPLTPMTHLRITASRAHFAMRPFRHTVIGDGIPAKSERTRRRLVPDQARLLA